MSTTTRPSTISSVGVLQAESLVKGLKERFPDVKPWNVELFGGSPDDNNAFFFYDGAMTRPAADDRLPARSSSSSGQMGMDKVGTLRWDGAVAQARMDNLLSANYTDKKVNAVLSPYDGLSRGIISSLKGVGYDPGPEMPIVTGQDAELPSVKGMIAGEQYSTVFKDTRELAQGDRQDGRRRDAGQGAGSQRHQDLQQRRQGRSVEPADALCCRQGRHPEDRWSAPATTQADRSDN